MAEVEKRIDALYALPLDEFTAARNELAASLKAIDAEASKRVKALAKPNAAAWLLNRLARVARKDVDAFLDVGERLRAAEAEALSGKGARALRDAAEEEREATAVLVKRAEILAREAEIGVTPALSQKLGDTLRAAVVDSEARDLLLRGRLSADLQRVGFGEAAPSGAKRRAPAAAPKPAAGARSQKDDAAREEARRRAEEERERARLAGEARRTSLEAERLEKAARNAERESERLARVAAEASGRAKQAKDRAAELRKQLREAKRAAERAHEKL